MHVVAGLGNPGKEFDKTKHNAGFMVLERLAKKFKTPLKFKKKLNSNIGEISFGNKKAILLMPHTFMNNSGIAVEQIAKTHKIPPENIIVVHDELDLPFGAVKIKKGGSSAGHKGIESIISRIGSKDFIRIRVGIGGEMEFTDDVDGARYVLSIIPKTRQQEYKISLEAAVDAVQEIIVNGYAKAMNHFNRAS